MIGNFLNYIENEKKFSFHTIRSYKADLFEFIDFLEQYDTSLTFIDIDKSAIQFFIQNASKKGCADKTLQRIFPLFPLVPQ